MFRTLHRDVSLVKYIAQPYENANNNILSWLFTTLLFSVCFSVFFSQFIPIVPKYITENIRLFGFVVNKFGFLFISFLLFHLIKGLATYLFYGSIQELSKFGRFIFVMQKFYMIASVVILIMSLILYYLPIDKQKFFIISILLFILAFILKIAIYLFHNERILPGEWYYKFLYICTLQILPILVMWKFWFF